ncbi:UBX domain-containing protein 4-like [Ylistrum balloti]|uniref:UBX domain-containing protein 4-like n=1 Tax=Ylistrum balloti TaxID=509963 RepID=UPI0029059A1A|nr:UBX domain-containing protein 4-like [Ylistrum balloti]
MEWFPGSIPQAIQTAKQNNALFVVYVRGKNEDTEKMDDVWKEENVISTCKSNKCTVIKIQGDSQEGKFFGEIYPILFLPSAYFIGPNGIPLEITGGHVESDVFIQNINTAQQKLQDNISKQRPAAPAAAAPVAAASEPVPMETTSATDSQPVEKPPIEERIAVVKEKMEQKRTEKLQKEKEDAKLKEEERRKLGKDLHKLKQYQEDRQRKELEDEIKKDREENKKMREKIKEQIARDREEKAQLYKRKKEEQDKEAEEKKKAKLQAKQQAAAMENARRSEKARLQIRLPDGSSISNIFDPSDTLDTVHQFITASTGNQMSLSTIYPKRSFTEEDRSETLVSLGLAPTAVLIAVNQRSQSAAPYRGSGEAVSEGGLLSMLMAPFMMLWNAIYSLVFGGSGATPPAGQEPTQQQRAEPQRWKQQQGANTSHQKRQNTKDGNITRFRNIEDDDDDENATWNGNSTQQM